MQVYREITPLKEPDVFVVIDSVSNGFNYPIHNHPEFELNLVMGISGTRIVGDSTERYTDFDLVLIGPYLYHKWDGDEELQKNNVPYRVITIQFGLDLFNAHFLQKEKFYKIRQLLEDSRRGVKFYGKSLEEAIKLIVDQTQDKGFSNVIGFLSLLNLLSNTKDKSFLASEGFSPQKEFKKNDRHRIQTAYGYILKNFSNADLKIIDIAKLVNMSESAFSHFFYKNTNKYFTQFLIDVRLGHACKSLLDTDNTIKQVCFESGFNNLANFNRLFKKYRNCTPLEYRQKYDSKSNFDWTKQKTPWQFIPTNSSSKKNISPSEYSTRLFHV